ncbi:hypothetical protein MTO96_002427 [Rhipicephalus appendiculatus]
MTRKAWFTNRHITLLTNRITTSVTRLQISLPQTTSPDTSSHTSQHISPDTSPEMTRKALFTYRPYDPAYQQNNNVSGPTASQPSAGVQSQLSTTSTASK